jgi:transcriptional regulator with XRE-family HTH domain
MQRVVNRKLIDSWIADAYPNALTKLSVASKVPASSISKIRQGRVPKDRLKLEALARAIGVEVDQLFPVLPDGKERAS